MSVRKLTSVQEARRILRERRARCSAEIFSQVTRRYPLFARADPRKIRDLLLTAQRKGEAARFRLHADGGALYYWARKLRDGRIAVGYGAATTVEQARAYAKISSNAFADYFRPHRCPCTPRELVAIDTLLERGDKYAERLAKACKRGGGILEGASNKKRRHR